MVTTPPGVQHTLLVVGDGEVADALESMATTLGWTPVVVSSLEGTLREIPGADSVVVLSHHDGVDGPALAAALEGPARYIGGMGSRKTQARRRTWMLENGVTEELADSVRGPAGLDIGANTPAEIAVSMLAEIIAVRRGVSGGSISDRDGPIHPGLAPGTAECPAG
jgi:xanthine dehydrogenase accessory factor